MVLCLFVGVFVWVLPGAMCDFEAPVCFAPQGYVGPYVAHGVGVCPVKDATDLHAHELLGARYDAEWSAVWERAGYVPPCFCVLDALGF